VVEVGDATHPFIVLEGLGGVGKTTVGKILAEKIGGVYVKTPTDSFLSARKEIDACADPMARFFFYLSTVIQASAEISHILETAPVVCDKYILATMCWHRAMGVDVHVPKFVNIRIPDFTFLLTCSDLKRIERLDRRDGSKLLSDDLEEAYSQESQQYNPIVLDNSSDDPLIVVGAVLKIIGG
jgi:thymidylate kinase